MNFKVGMYAEAIIKMRTFTVQIKDLNNITPKQAVVMVIRGKFKNESFKIYQWQLKVIHSPEDRPELYL